MKCNLCPKKCNVDRAQTLGFCHSTNTMRLARAAAHYCEEPVISGTMGSGTIFFSNCNIKCCYCQNYPISHESFGKDVSESQFIDIVKRLEDTGVHNINLVSPTQYSRLIISAFSKYKPSIPIVYNTNGYERVEVIRALKNTVDIYLTDFKYADNELSKLYSSVDDYLEQASLATSEMLISKGKPVIENGLMKSGVIIRHLVLPGCMKNTESVLTFIRQNFYDYVISVMLQYTPLRNTPYANLNRKLSNLEIKFVRSLVDRLDFEQGYIQEASSSDESYIPPFDLTGL